MKNTILIVIISFLFNSCTDTGSSSPYKYTIINNTGKTLKILSYDTRFENPTPKIFIINVNEVLVQKGKEYLGNTYNFISFFKGDSIRIIYGNEKIQVFTRPATCPENNRNPLNFCVYNKSEETFTFTPQDYENATLCDGSCE